MIRKLSRSLPIGILIFVLAGCTATATPQSPGGGPTSPPATQAVSPTSPPTSIPATATQPEPTATESPSPTPPATGVIQHFPAGQDFTVTTIDMVDATNGWAIGGMSSVGDHVLTTADGGSTWKDVTPPQPLAADQSQQVADGFFQDAQAGWVTYAISGGNPVPAQSVVWSTTDGGATWRSSQPLDITNLSEIYVPSNLQFVDGQNGWLLVHVGVGMNHDYVVIFHSTDAGASWGRILDPFNDGGIQSCSKTAMLFTDASHGWLTGDCNGVKAGVLLFSSSDSGASWQEVSLPDPVDAAGLYENMNMACGSYDPSFFAGGQGHLSVTCSNYTTQQITHSYYIYTTQDGGSTWSGMEYPGHSLYFFSTDTGWAISPKLQLTTDGGKTWKPIADVTWTPQMDFISEQVGWAVARSESAMALVHSTDGGATWAEMAPSVGK